MIGDLRGIGMDWQTVIDARGGIGDRREGADRVFGESHRAGRGGDFRLPNSGLAVCPKEGSDKGLKLEIEEG